MKKEKSIKRFNEMFGGSGFSIAKNTSPLGKITSKVENFLDKNKEYTFSDISKKYLNMVV